MKTELEILKQQEIELRNQLRQNIQKQNELIISIYVQESGFKIGDEILYNNKPGKIVDLQVCYSYAYPIVRFYKKDGTLGVVDRKVYRMDTLEHKYHENNR